MNNNPGGASGERTSRPVQETQETWVRSLGWDDPLEEGKATYSTLLAWRIPWTEESGVGGGGATVQRVAQSWARLKRLHTDVIMKTEGKTLHATPRLNLTHSRTKLEAAERALSDPIHLQVNEG